MVKTLIKVFTVIGLCILILFLYLPNPNRGEMEDFREQVSSDLVFLATINDSRVQIIEAVGEDIPRRIYAKQDVYRSQALINVLWVPKPACLAANVEAILNKTYRQLAKNRGWTFVTLCPIGNREGFIGAGFVKYPELDTLKIQEDLAKEMEI